MFACLDVHYHRTRQGTATAAAIVFENWQDTQPAAQHVIECTGVGDYEPGQFYRRELAPLQAILADIRQPLDGLVIDASCQLGADGAPGLGVHLFNSLGQGTAVIGVAKSRFRDTEHAVQLYRGKSQKPLFVTSVGIVLEDAAQRIASMAGPYRLPTLIKSVDLLCRTAEATGPEPNAR